MKSRGAEQRPNDAETWHHMPSPGVASCGADYANMSKTAVVANVTCAACIRKLVARDQQARCGARFRRCADRRVVVCARVKGHANAHHWEASA